MGVPSSWFSAVSMPSMISCEQEDKNEARRDERRDERIEEDREERRKLGREESGKRQEHRSWCNDGNHVAVREWLNLKLTSGGRLDIVGGCVKFALACKVEIELMAGNRGIVERTVGGTSITATPRTSCRCGHSIHNHMYMYIRSI